jgi:hypothetical protein
MEIGNAAEWAAALGSIATAIIAGIALNAWRDQMRGTSRHQAAAEIAEAAQLTRYHFYDARNSMYLASEFPAAYHANANRTHQDEADGWAYVFKNRWDLLGTHILRLATLRAKAGALLSDDCATALEGLARKGRELHNFFADRIEQYRVGPNIVSQWTDQKWVQRVRDSVAVIPGDRSDPYSVEFEEKFASLKRLIDPFV